jgi:hypothetical protein
VTPAVGVTPEPVIVQHITIFVKGTVLYMMVMKIYFLAIPAAATAKPINRMVD